MNSTVMILAFCTAAAFSISIKKGLMPFWEQKKEMALQIADFWKLSADFPENRSMDDI